MSNCVPSPVLSLLQGKLRFYDLHADGAKLQIMTDPSMYTAGDADEWDEVRATTSLSIHMIRASGDGAASGSARP